MEVKPKFLFSDKILIWLFIFLFVPAILSYFFWYKALSAFLFIFYLFFLCFNLISRPKKFSIKENVFSYDGKSYHIPNDLRDYKIKNEVLRIRTVKMVNQLLVLKFKDGHIFILPSRMYENYPDLKAKILELINR